ncbi:hypothetical protein [Rhizobium sullae]|uniref:Uncharacterized protein n=1 Tax=Rhizobium sullae TaxID=50338 RepID=A0A4R3PWH3_RHISU|nr:hypothetical protein [Rhizobium sullae]TCU12579.1 hypothetical protein EV132_11515 [Rhizobium sullae]
MCSLCGILGGNEHWADAFARPGVYTRSAERIDRRRERARRVAIANCILDAFGLSISDWQGSSFLLSTRTGKTEIIEDLGHLWPAAERLAGRPLDPLAEPLVDRLEANRHG